MSIKMTPCQSSQVKAHGYDPATKKLHVEYSSGGVYEYQGVPQTLYDGLCNCKSVGQFLNSKVKAAGFVFRKVGK